MDFIKEHFDKVLLTFLFLVLFGAVIHMAHSNLDAQDVAWARESAGTVLGALIGLITGVRIGMAVAASAKTEDKPNG